MRFTSAGVRRSVGCLVIGLLLLLGLARPAKAVPAFAAQTGQPCQMCHVGGFGPQLTPYGRNFKLNGYTQRTGPIDVPLALMAVASYVRTDKAQPEPPAPHFHDNDNLALDQVSLFLAGGVGSHFGGFVQATYDGVGRSFSWDNADLRAVTAFDVGKTNVVVGASLNNNPTVQDVWNTLPAWGFPYTTSALAPSPVAPILAGAFAQETAGLTGYAWVNAEYYAEAGAYASPGASLLTHLGVDPTSPGNIDGAAPYARLAWQKAIAGHNVEVGAFFFQAGIFPGRDESAGTSDIFRDIGVDASDVLTLPNTDVITVNARYLDERQDLRASVPLGLAANLHDSLHDFRIDASYYWRNKIGGTIQLFDTTGSADPLLYAANRTFKPDSSGVMLQIDGTPFGGGSQPMRRLNLRAGLQYVAYARFDGAGDNFDGAGRNASDQNTLRIFLWLAL
jgi:hypothetical protein